MSEIIWHDGSHGNPGHEDEYVVIDYSFLDTVSSSDGKSWHIIISIQDVDVEFKMDTGAEVTAISAETFK